MAEHEKIDRASVALSWPQKITQIDLLPTKYISYFFEWINLGMPVNHIIHAVQTNRWDLNRPEYAIAYYNHQILLVTDSFFKGLQSTILSAEDIIQVDVKTALLDSICTIYYKTSSDVEKISFHFNKATEDFFLPIYNIILQHDDNYDQDIAFYPNNRMEEIRQHSYLMSNYCKLCFRLDPLILHHYYHSTPCLKKKKEKNPREYFAGALENGLVLIQVVGYETKTTYLLWKNMNKIFIDDAQLHIQSDSQQILKLPINVEFSSNAVTFINHCNIQKKLKRTQQQPGDE